MDVIGHCWPPVLDPKEPSTWRPKQKIFIFIAPYSRILCSEAPRALNSIPEIRLTAKTVGIGVYTCLEGAEDASTTDACATGTAGGVGASFA